MNSPIRHPHDTDGNGAPTAIKPSHPVRFHVYKNATFLGETAFHQNHIAIGSSPAADLRLEHQAIAAFHAFVYISNGQVFLSNKYPNNGLRLNGNAVKEAEIQPENIIDIGPFSLHIKLGEADHGDRLSSPAQVADEVSSNEHLSALAELVEEETIDPETYSVVLLNRYSSEEDRRQAAERLARFLRADVAVVAAALKKPTLVVKKQLIHSDALRLQQRIQSVGFPCFIQEDVSSSQPPVQAEDEKQSAPETSDTAAAPLHQPLGGEAKPMPEVPENISAQLGDEGGSPVNRTVKAIAPEPKTPTGCGQLAAALDAVPKPSAASKPIETPPDVEAAGAPPTPSAEEAINAAECNDEINFADIAAEISQITASEVAPKPGKQEQSHLDDSATHFSEQTIDAPLPFLLDEDDGTNKVAVDNPSVLETTGDFLELEAYEPPEFDLSAVDKDDYVEDVDLTDISAELVLEPEEEEAPAVGFDTSHAGAVQESLPADDTPWLLLEPESPEDAAAEFDSIEKQPLESVSSGENELAATLALDDSIPDMALEIEQALTAEKLVSEKSVETDTRSSSPLSNEPPPIFEASSASVDFSVFGYNDDDEDEDDDEGIWEAPFCLDERLCQSVSMISNAAETADQVHVVKTINGVVMDAGVLKQGSRYTINTIDGNFVLADNKTKKGAHVFFDTHFGGYTVKNGQVQADLASFQNNDYLFNKKKEIYRLPLEEDGIVVIEDGDSQYRVFRTHESPEPELDFSTLPVEADAESWNWRHWVGSFAVHVIVVMIIASYTLIQPEQKKDDKPHFVKIDTSMLGQMQEKKEPVVKPKPKPEPKPEPMKVADKVVAKPKKQPVAKAPAKNTKKQSKKAVASAKQPSRDPNAGGGFGKGNIKNRNVNQTGLLSILSNTDLGGPSEAIAAVTNIDAVKVPGATDKNFTVGGIKGALGDGKISVTPASASGGGSGIMQTKGAKQVLRSAGASGPGTVAAMEKGKTGNRKVQAMVTAKMTRSVKIEGGMSKEAVKRVIDQHIAEISYSYESALMTNPSISGRVTFEWKILGNGQVGEVRIVSSSLNSDDLHRRIKALIKTWQFPKPVGGAEVVVSYPFVFDQVGF